MNTEKFGVPPRVGLIADPAAVPRAVDTLFQVEAELRRFGVNAEPTQVLAPEAAGAYVRGVAGPGRCAWVVASAESTLAEEVGLATDLPVLHVPVGGLAENNVGLLWPEPVSGKGSPDRGVHATLAIGEAGACNAALFVVSMLALTDDALRKRWREFRQTQTQTVLTSTLPPV